MRRAAEGWGSQSVLQHQGDWSCFLEPTGFFRGSGLDLSFRLKVMISDFLPCGLANQGVWDMQNSFYRWRGRKNGLGATLSCATSIAASVLELQT